MTRSTIFKNNQTQSVRLPKDVAFPDNIKEVDIAVVGDSRIVSPGGRGWAHWFEHGSLVTDDFLDERDQPVAEKRPTW